MSVDMQSLQNGRFRSFVARYTCLQNESWQDWLMTTQADFRAHQAIHMNWLSLAESVASVFSLAIDLRVETNIM